VSPPESAAAAAVLTVMLLSVEVPPLIAIPVLSVPELPTIDNLSSTVPVALVNDTVSLSVVVPELDPNTAA
jgi:hypothetical protein